MSEYDDARNYVINKLKVDGAVAAAESPGLPGYTHATLAEMSLRTPPYMPDDVKRRHWMVGDRSVRLSFIDHAELEKYERMYFYIKDKDIAAHNIDYDSMELEFHHSQLFLMFDLALHGSVNGQERRTQQTEFRTFSMKDDATKVKKKGLLALGR